MPFPADPVPDGNVFLPHHFGIGVIIAVYSFYFIWPYYHAVGASGALLGLGIAADDVLSHSFGVWTPVEWLWETFLYGLVSSA